jgi:transcriptional regulator with XRE-family HTH domain
MECSKVKINKKKKYKPSSILIEHLALKKLRIDLCMTLDEASINLPIGPKGLAAIENGRVFLDKKRIEEIVSSYGLTYLDFLREKIIIDKERKKRKRPATVKHVLKNSDRRSYQKIITKECQVLKSMRCVKAITQDNASLLCGYSRPTIGHIENGRIKLTNERIKHIVHSYGYKVEHFEDNMKKEELRFTIEKFCIQKIRSIEEDKLILMRDLISNF